MKIAIFIIAALFAFSGCSTKHSSPITHSTIKPKAQCNTAPKYEYILTVDTYNNEYNTKGIYYSTGLKHERYLYSFWSTSPVTALQNSIITNLTDCKYAVIYNDMPTSVPEPKNLRVILQNFDQIFNEDGSSYGYLRVQVWLLDIKGQRSKTFEIKVPSKTNNADGGIEALNSASEIFITELMKWVKEAS